jgi:glycolate oxidase iron-sulfur subunit
VIPNPLLFRLSLAASFLGKPLAPVLAAFGFYHGAAMLRLSGAAQITWRNERPRTYSAEGERKGRVAILAGCANQVLRPAINAAAIRLLNRAGIEVVVPPGEGCCGSLTHHLGREHETTEFVHRNISAWTREIEGEGLDAILVTASGCGTTIKDYGFMLRNDPGYATNAARVAALTQDVAEYLMKVELTFPQRDQGLVVAYQSACSLQHGQKVHAEPKALLAKAGFAVRDIPEAHLCCGSAGTYNMLQPELAARLRDRKVANIAAVAPDVIATGNIGCITQLKTGTRIPIVHTIELLDWAAGGPIPAELARTRQQAA